MDLMKPYMPPSRENYERCSSDIHARVIQMWAGCIWVPIYEVMTRKHLKMVTLEENLEMAADIGIDATTSLDDALRRRWRSTGRTRRSIVLPFARYQLPRNAIRMSSEPLARCSYGDPHAEDDHGVDDDRRAAAPVPRRRGGDG